MALVYSDPKTWDVSEMANAVLMNQYARDNLLASVHRLKRKQVDESINNSTTLQNDDELFWPLGASETWYFRVFISILQTETGPGAKIAFTIPSGTVMAMNSPVNDDAGFVYQRGRWETSGNAVIAYSNATDGDVRYNEATSIDIDGIVTSSTTTGNLQLQWAQSASVASNVMTVLADHSQIWGMKLS